MSLKEWLADYCYGLREARITIGRTTYDAVFYRQMVDPKGMTNTRGDVIEPYEVEAVMLVGELPASYKRTSKTVFRFPGDERDWYVASWTTVETASDPKFAEFHYDKKATFQLRPWGVDSPIDVPYERPYDRVEAKVLVTA
jgi:hypothetical protein